MAWDRQRAAGIDSALRKGFHGLPPGSSLARLLSETRGVSNVHGQPPLIELRLLEWADAHFRHTGSWPTRKSGDLQEDSRESWKRINEALIAGNRTLPGGSSLARLLAKHRGVRNRKALPSLEPESILLWADHHFKLHGRWPSVWSGKIDAAPYETWRAVDSAFKVGGRGLAGCGYRSLAHILDERGGRLRRRGNRPAVRTLPAE